jgi:hypothetical protein
MSQPENITACNNATCPMRERCRRFTGPNKVGNAIYQPKRNNGQWVCDQYWYNGQKFIK